MQETLFTQFVQKCLLNDTLIWWLLHRSTYDRPEHIISAYRCNLQVFLIFQRPTSLIQPIQPMLIKNRQLFTLDNVMAERFTCHVWISMFRLQVSSLQYHRHLLHGEYIFNDTDFNKSIEWRMWSLADGHAWVILQSDHRHRSKKQGRQERFLLCYVLENSFKSRATPQRLHSES